MYWVSVGLGALQVEVTVVPALLFAAHSLEALQTSCIVHVH